jgi:hypothetical protein
VSNQSNSTDSNQNDSHAGNEVSGGLSTHTLMNTSAFDVTCLVHSLVARVKFTFSPFLRALSPPFGAMLGSENQRERDSAPEEPPPPEPGGEVTGSEASERKPKDLQFCEFSEPVQALITKITATEDFWVDIMHDPDFRARIDPFVNIGERYQSIQFLPEEWETMYLNEDDIMLEVIGIFLREFPRKITQAQIKIALMREEFDHTHPLYFSKKHAKYGEHGECYYKVTAWLGILEHSRMVNEANETVNEVIAYHGTPLPNMIHLINSGDVLRKLGHGVSGDKIRQRSGENLKEDEQYIADFSTSRRYTIPRVFGGRNGVKISTLVAVEPESTRNQHNVNKARW